LENKNCKGNGTLIKILEKQIKLPDPLIFKTASIAQDRPVSQSRVTFTRLQLAQSAHPDLPSFYLAISKNRQCQLRRLLLDGDVGDFIE